MQSGIEALGVHIPSSVLDLELLARHRGVAASKFPEGLGQCAMAVPPPDEDIVTMAAAAGQEALEGSDPGDVDLLVVGTESGIDQSKAAAVYVHELLGLPAACIALETKQACFAATAGLWMALTYVQRWPGRKALVIASDVARYEPGSAAEPTQGAGAVALLVSSAPGILALDSPWGCFTRDVMDFWRPNYRRDAVVDGKYSIRVYLEALGECWRRYAEASGLAFGDHGRFCYHLPFTRMAEKAHLSLARANGAAPDGDGLRAAYEDSLAYGRVVGNCYAASLYLALASALETADADLAGRRMALFSYGSGCTAAFFSGMVQDGYRERLHARRHRRALAIREALSLADYEAYMAYELATDGGTHETPRVTRGPFRLAGIEGHSRIYERIAVAASELKGAA